MSYDFAVLTRESVGIGGRKRWPRLSSLSSRTTSPTRSRTDACEILSPTLRKRAPRMRKTAGYRCGPSTSGRTASRYPTTYADVDTNLTTLLLLAARQRLARADHYARTADP